MNVSIEAPAALKITFFAAVGPSGASPFGSILRALDALAGWLTRRLKDAGGAPGERGHEGSGGGDGGELGWGPMPGSAAAVGGEPNRADQGEGWGPVPGALRSLGRKRGRRGHA